MNEQYVAVPNVDCSLEGVKLAVDRQLYPCADMASKMGAERKTRGGMVTLALGQVDALIRMAEKADEQNR